MSYPDKKRIDRVLERIKKKKIKPTFIPSKNASPIEQMKFNICQQIIKFKRDNQYANKDLAEIIGIGPAVVSRLLHCQIDRFKVDSLLSYYFCLVISSQDKELISKFKDELVYFLVDEAA